MECGDTTLSNKGLPRDADSSSNRGGISRKTKRHDVALPLRVGEPYCGREFRWNIQIQSPPASSTTCYHPRGIEPLQPPSCPATTATALPLTALLDNGAALSPSRPSPIYSAADPTARLLLRPLPSPALLPQPQQQINDGACPYPPSDSPEPLQTKGTPSSLHDEAASQLLALILPTRMPLTMKMAPLAARPPRPSPAACPSEPRHSAEHRMEAAQVQMVKAVASTGLSNLGPVPRALSRSPSGPPSPPRPPPRSPRMIAARA